MTFQRDAFPPSLIYIPHSGGNTIISIIVYFLPPRLHFTYNGVSPESQSLYCVDRISFCLLTFCDLKKETFLTSNSSALITWYSTKKRAARGWTVAHQATPSGPLDQTHTLDPTPDTPGARFLPCDPIIIKRFRVFSMIHEVNISSVIYSANLWRLVTMNRRLFGLYRPRS